jgi:hypothetical protein
LLALGRADFGFYWNLKAVIVQILCVYAGGRLGGLYGIVIGLLFAHLYYFVAHYPLLIRALIGPCLGEYLANIFPSVLAAVIMGVLLRVFGLGTAVLNLGAPLNLGILAAAGAITYLCLSTIFQQRRIKEAKAVLYAVRAD